MTSSPVAVARSSWHNGAKRSKAGSLALRDRDGRALAITMALIDGAVF